MWQETTKQERNRKIFQEEIDAWLPERVLDFHVHVFNEGVVPEGETYPCAGHPLRKYDLDDLRRDLADAYPGRETSAVCFGTPHRGYDRERNNRYLAEVCDRKRFFPFRLLDAREPDPGAVRRDIVEHGFMGLKPYLNYVEKPDPNDVEIVEMLPPWSLDIANDLGLLVMLHVPRKQRLADPVNQRQIVELCTAYPRVRVVLAHVGRAYFKKNIVGNLANLKDLPNLTFDISMLNHPGVLEYLFQTVPPEKVVYGTDTPIALAPGKSVEINDQYTYVTPVPWHLSISDDHGKIRFTSFLYEELRAIHAATQRLGLGREFLEGLFYGNGMRLLAGADTMA